MTTLRESAIMELEKLPEDKLSFIIKIMQEVNGLSSSPKGLFKTVGKLCI